MDQMELRSGKALVKRDDREDSDNDFEEGAQDSLVGYAVGGTDGEEIAPSSVAGVREPTSQPPPLSAMDVSSVRYLPASVMTSTDQTSARGLPRPVLELHKSN